VQIVENKATLAYHARHVMSVLRRNILTEKNKEKLRNPSNQEDQPTTGIR